MVQEKRLRLHKQLIKILGSNNVYFQPPTNMKYPCIKYEIAGMSSSYADNISYASHIRYTIIYIDRNPDSPILEKLLNLPMCSLDRTYKSDGLNHYVFTLFY